MGLKLNCNYFLLLGVQLKVEVEKFFLLLGQGLEPKII